MSEMAQPSFGSLVMTTSSLAVYHCKLAHCNLNSHPAQWGSGLKQLLDWWQDILPQAPRKLTKLPIAAGLSK